MTDFATRHCERREAIHQFDFGSNFAEKNAMAAPPAIQSTAETQPVTLAKPVQPGNTTNIEPQINPKITA